MCRARNSPTKAATCKFPGCQDPPEPPDTKLGRPPEYCASTGHNAITAWRERRWLGTVVADQGTTVGPGSDRPGPVVRVSGAELLGEMRALAERLAALGTLLADTVITVADRDVGETIELEAALSAAAQRVFAAETAKAEAERRTAAAIRMQEQADQAAELIHTAWTDAEARAREAAAELTAARTAYAAELDLARAQIQDAQYQQCACRNPIRAG